MKQEKKDKHFIGKPYYEGGVKALRQFIASHLKYPVEALKDRIEGTVFVNYTINHQGKVIEARVISNLGHGCDEEALRLVKLLRYKVPKVRGVRVTFHRNIQIHFRLPEVKQGPQYQYQLKATEKKKEEEKTSSSYSYTITYTSNKKDT